MKVAICFIGTGKYLNFLPKYYENIEKYFLPNTEKTFLVFTDGELNDLPDNIIPYYQEHLDWPYITLTRFDIIKRASDFISKNDWFVFIDADALVVDTITEDEFFDNTKSFFGVHHPCHYLNMPPHNNHPGAFETNPLSKSCILDSDDTSVYYQGCLWGGRVPDVIEMINELSDRVNSDLERDVIAVWHDESHLNKFYCENKGRVNTLSSSYAYPEVFSGHCNFEPKIVHLAKNNSKYHV
jgi:hypothetical protein